MTEQKFLGSATARAEEKTRAEELDSIRSPSVPAAEIQSNRAISLGAFALGAFALGAIAIGACAIGSLAISRLTIGKSQIRALEIDALTVHRLHVKEFVIDERSCGSAECNNCMVADRKNPKKTRSTALITGASSGIGEAFARLLAAEGSYLILVARSEEKLHALAAELTEKHNIRAVVVAADLSDAGAALGVWEKVEAQGLIVDLLINNAGFGSYGPFEDIGLPLEIQQISLNITALIELTHLFLPGMLARSSGAVVNVSSTAGFQPVPYMAVYGATKAFVLSFSEALWAEYRSRGIRI